MRGSDQYAPVVGDIRPVDEDLVVDLAGELPGGAGVPTPGMGPVPGTCACLIEILRRGGGDVGEEFSEFLGVFLSVVYRGETVVAFLAIPTSTALFCEAFLLGGA